MAQLPYFYEPAIISHNTHFTLNEDTSHHCIQVLRMKAEEQLQLTDGKGNLYTASISKADKRHAEVMIQHSVSNIRQPKKICIAISLLKNNNRFEWFLEKATEMSVQEIIPLICRRTERQHFRYERMNNIVISAMLQSRQSWLPVLHQPTDIKEIMQQSAYTNKLVAHCAHDEGKIALQNLYLQQDAQILIGPEGDFTSDEITAALQHNYKPVSLGDTRLRTETAGMVASALLIYSH